MQGMQEKTRRKQPRRGAGKEENGPRNRAAYTIKYTISAYFLNVLIITYTKQNKNKKLLSKILTFCAKML